MISVQQPERQLQLWLYLSVYVARRQNCDIIMLKHLLVGRVNSGSYLHALDVALFRLSGTTSQERHPTTGSSEHDSSPSLQVLRPGGLCPCVTWCPENSYDTWAVLISPVSGSVTPTVGPHNQRKVFRQLYVPDALMVKWFEPFTVHPAVMVIAVKTAWIRSQYSSQSSCSVTHLLRSSRVL